MFVEFTVLMLPVLQLYFHYCICDCVYNYVAYDVTSKKAQLADRG